MKTHTDFNGQIVAYVYDDEADPLIPSFEKTKLGRLVFERHYDNAAAYNNGAGVSANVVHATESYTTIYGHFNNNVLVPGYDANGSLLESHRTGNGAVDVANQYDLRNRLSTSIATPSGVAATNTIYAYDSDGNRVKESTNGVATYFVNDLANPTGYSQTLEEKPAAGDGTAPTRSYVIGQQIIAQADATNGKLDFEYDGHGSTRGLIVDSTGAVATWQIFAYDAYGNRKDGNTLVTAMTSILYTGQRFDAAIKEYFLRARNYNPVTGTFSSFDPQQNNYADPISLHKYLYANGNPINRFDPSGFYTQADGYAAEAAIEEIYDRDHPIEYAADLVDHGSWTRLGALGVDRAFRLKPDILNRGAKKSWLEIKPLTPSGIAKAAIQFAAYSTALAPFGYGPEVSWNPSTHDAIAGTLPIWFFNAGGIVFYTDPVGNLQDLIALGSIAAVRSYLSTQAGIRLGQSVVQIFGGRISGLVGARVGGDEARGGGHFGIGILLGVIGFI